MASAARGRAAWAARGVRTGEAAPHTEADAAGILLAAMVMLGAAVGPGPHILAGNERHGPGLFVVLVGDTSKGRKGTAVAVARALVSRVDETFTAGRIIGGFGSGEALVDALRDKDADHDAAPDKRLCLVEPEYARMLKVAARDGSTLAQVVRAAWDGTPIETRSRARTVVASDYLVGAVCQVTSGGAARPADRHRNLRRHGQPVPVQLRSPWWSAPQRRERPRRAAGPFRSDTDGASRRR